jgi:hypothetical protein
MLNAIADVGSSIDVYAGMGIGIAGVLVTAFIILYLRRYIAKKKLANGAQTPPVSNPGDLSNITNQPGSLQGQQPVVADGQTEENKLGGLAEKLAQFNQGQSEGEGESTMDKQSEEQNIFAQVQPEQEPESTENQPEVLSLFTQTQAEDELESDEDQSSELDSEKETEGQPKNEDSMLSLFETEIEDESGIAEFAQRLDDVDVNSLIGEAQKIRDLLKGKP